MEVPAFSVRSISRKEVGAIRGEVKNLKTLNCLLWNYKYSNVVVYTRIILVISGFSSILSIASEVVGLVLNVPTNYSNTVAMYLNIVVFYQ